jgi:flagellar biosynthesis/type III secretory pathway ATPase
MEPYPLRAAPIPAHARSRLGGKLDLGVRALNAFATCCTGQRMGIFSGSGVGKSILLSMIARNTDADVIVIGLVGERGREVKEFIEDDLAKTDCNGASLLPRRRMKRRSCAARRPSSLWRPRNISATRVCMCFF